MTVESLNLHFLEPLELTRGQLALEKWAHHAGGVVVLVTVSTPYANMGTVLVSASLCMLGVKRGEVGSSTLITHWDNTP